MADLIDPSGTVVEVPDEYVDQALREGFQPASPEAAQLRAREVKYGGYSGAAAAAGLGALSGASLGMSDLAAAAMGQANAVRGYQEVNPEAHTVGVIGGALIGPKIPGLGAPAQLAHRAGHAAEHLVGSFGGKILGGIARGGVEGALFGAGAGASEVALARDPMSMEKAAAVILHHAAMDAGIGAAFGLGAGYLKGRGARGAAPASELLAKAESKGVGRFVDGLDNISSRVGGTERGAINRLTATKAGVRGIEMAEQAEAVVVREARDAAEELAASVYIPAKRRSLPAIHSKLESASRVLGELPEAERAAQIPVMANQLAEDLLPKVSDEARKGAELKMYRALDALDEAEATIQGAEQRLYQAQSVGDATAAGAASKEADAAKAIYAKLEATAEAAGDKFRTLERQAVQRISDLDTVANLILEPRLAKAAEHAGLARDLRNVDRARSPMARVIGGALGGAVGGAPGMVIGAVAGGLAHPGSMMRQVAAIDDVLARFGGKVKTGMGGFFRSSGSTLEVAPHIAGPAERYYERQGERAARALRIGYSAIRRRNQGDPRSRYEHSRNEAMNIIGNPAATHEKVHESLGPLSQVNPQASALMAAKLREVSLFLLKRDPAGDTQLMPRRPNPSLAEIGIYLRRERVARDPLAVVDLLKQGKLNREHVETVKELWPTVYEELQRNAVEQMAKLAAEGRQLPYKKRLQLGVLLDVETDPSLSPAVMMQLQRSYQEHSKPSQPPGNNPRKPQLADSYALDTEKRHGK